MACCLGKIVAIGAGRDLPVHHPENHHPENHRPENHHPENHHPENHRLENHRLENHRPENHHPENHHPENHRPENPIMKLNEFGMIVQNQLVWLEKQYEYVVLHNFVVMPNHVHAIVEINRLKVEGREVKIKSLSSLIGAFKTTSSKLIHLAGFIDFSWHRSFHDRIIKNKKAYTNISNYIEKNPGRWKGDIFYE
jgi:REP element-mobilizing transposase RayT